MVEQKKNNITNSSWNPFIPTERDIERSDMLASKNAALAGVLSFFILPVGLIYLNRGINSLKILGYSFAVALVFGIVSGTEDDSNGFANLIGLIGGSAVTAEQVLAVNKARQRAQEKSTLASNSSKYSNFQANTEAVKLLKELKKKYEANEISEEEFEIQKQKIMGSI